VRPAWRWNQETAVRVAAFGALAALAGAQWMRLVESPPVGRVAIAVGVATAAAALIATIAAVQPRATARVIAAVAAVVATAAALVWIGIPAHLLDPGSWGELLDEIGGGFSGLAGDVEYPYHGDNEWSRNVLLAGLPLALGLAAALAFWPGTESRLVRSTAPLVVLVATFGVGATVFAPEQPLLWGALLLLAILAWLWLPHLSGRDAIAGTVLVALAGAVALPVAGALDSEEPLVDFREWEFGRGKPATFNWDHSYGPLDWPREGTALAAMESDEAHYWKLSVLDQFNGTRWLRPEVAAGLRLETPPEVEESLTGQTRRKLNERWVEEIAVTIGPMESEFVLGAGAIVAADGVDVIIAPDGTLIAEGDSLTDGDEYALTAYAPDPNPTRLRETPEAYAPTLARYTQFTVPNSGGGGVAEGTDVQVPLRGVASIDDEARRAILDSPYAEMYQLSRRLTAAQPTAYDATQAVEQYFHTGFDYSESPPEHRYPLPAFVFDDRFGYCQQFSGAMALMLRMSGIPARVATGFSPGAPDEDQKDRYIVEDLDAHSWVEAYFPRIGWITFDPTPADSPADSQPTDPGGLAAAGALALGTRGNQGDRRKGFDPSKRGGGLGGETGGGFPIWTIPVALAGLILIALAAFGAITAVRRRRYNRLSPAARADAHLRELPGALARLGWPLAPAETLLALERRLYSYRKDAAVRFVAKLRAGRFSPTADDIPTLADRRAMRDDLAGGDGLRARLRALLALPPGGPTHSV
jgi:transglutaminase-like putative cysteine protease